MNWNQIERQWTEFAGSAGAHWSKLTDEDWHAITGTKGDLIRCVQRRYGIAREEAEKQVDEWSYGQMDLVEARGSDGSHRSPR